MRSVGLGLVSMALWLALLASPSWAAPTPQLVKDINPGAGDSIPGGPTFPFVNVNGTLLFTASDGPDGLQLWKSDGTSTGTQMVKNIGVGADPHNLVEANGKLFFVATDAAHGTELWTSDGTPGGTNVVRDINPGAASSTPGSLVNVNGTVFFTAFDPTNGDELWKSDGTLGGTQLVADIRSGSASSSPLFLTAFNGEVFFQADDGTTAGLELWKSDGTTTTMVKDICTPGCGSGPGDFTVVGSTLFFTADDGNGAGDHGRELWKTDGSGPGTQLVADINPGIFAAFDNPGSNNLGSFNGKLFFDANDGTHGIQLWSSDGSPAGTSMLDEINPGGNSFPGGFTALNSTTLLFSAFGPDGRELYKTNGMPGGTTELKDINPGASPNDSNPSDLLNVNGRIFFDASDGIHGAELWQSDGTAAGTTMVADINPSGDSLPGELTNIDGVLFFDANDGSHGFELWKLDTRATTSTAVSCTPSAVAVGQPASCTATVSNSGAGGSDPTGSVAFSSDSAGTFSSPSCTLVGSGTGSASCSVSYTPTAAGSGTHTITGAYGGDSGHTTSQGSTPLRVDGSAPTISIATPAAGATYARGQVVKASYSCTDPDGAADVASCAGPVASGAAIDTSTTGSHTFTVHATDRVGNSVSETVTYTVSAVVVPPVLTPIINTSGVPSTRTQGANVVVAPGISVLCRAGGRPCTVDLSATVIVPASAARVRLKKVVIGRAHFTIPAGRSRQLTFKLNSKGAQLLRRFKTLRVTVTVTSRVGSSRPVVTTKTITISAPPRRHRHHH